MQMRKHYRKVELCEALFNTLGKAEFHEAPSKETFQQTGVVELAPPNFRRSDFVLPNSQ